MESITVEFYNPSTGDLLPSPSTKMMQKCLATAAFSIKVPTRALSDNERQLLSDTLDRLLVVAKTIPENGPGSFFTSGEKFAIFDYINGFQFQGNQEEVSAWLNARKFELMAQQSQRNTWFQNEITKVWVGANKAC